MAGRAASKNIVLITVAGWYWLAVTVNGARYLPCRKGRVGTRVRP